MILASGPVQHLGVDPTRARIRFGESEEPAGAWSGRRHLVLDGKPAFELSYWCGTCPALFERLDGANHTVSLEDLAERLRSGVDSIENAVVAPFGHLLAVGRYLRPAVGGQAPGWSAPSSQGTISLTNRWRPGGSTRFRDRPSTCERRTTGPSKRRSAQMLTCTSSWCPWCRRHGMSQIVWRRFASSSRRRQRLRLFAVSTLDICQPATEHANTDYYGHWALTHLLLDGHHKFEAAAEAQRPLRLLALVSMDGSLARQQDLEHLITFRSRDPAQRAPGK